MKKAIPKTLAIAAGAALVAAFSLHESSRQYMPRPATVSDASEPSSMRWAKVDVLTGEYNPALRNAVFPMIKNHVTRAEALGMVFENRGPDNVGGRTRAIIEIFGAPDTMLVGSVTGGLFISYNGGGTWAPHPQFQNLDTTSSIISCIHQDTITGRIYIGTGSSFDEYGNQASVAWPGYGIFVSDDNGITFKHLSSTTPNNRYSTSGDPWIAVNRIRTDGNGYVYAATEFGFKRSTDQGETWEDVIYLGNTTQPSTQRYADVLAMKSGRVVAAQASGPIYISEDGEAGTFVQVNSNGLPISARRIVLSFSPQNEDHIYAMFINSSSCLQGVYHTLNGGDLWTTVLVPHDAFWPMEQGTPCTSGQGVYDACLGVSPLDENLFFLGGVELWRYDGNLTRVASENGSPPFQDVLPNYVHADKHYVYFSPNDPGRVYVTSDGGIAVSDDDGETWFGLNKGYVSTQFYGIAHGNDGQVVIGGTQDNGTLVTLGNNYSDPYVGFSIFGNDGIDCDMSQISGILFASSQNGLVVRADATQRSQSSFPVSLITPMNSGGPFHTVVKLWESLDDPTSQDSVVFEVEPIEQAIGVSNGIVRNYSETVYPVQSAAVIDLSSVQIYSGGMLLEVGSDLTTLEGDGEGSVSLNTDGSLNVTVTFEAAPSENSNVYVAYTASYLANSVLTLESDNLNNGLESYKFEYRLENNLSPGDVLKVQDPVQSWLFTTSGVQGLSMYRKALNLQVTPEAILLPELDTLSSNVEAQISSPITAMEFTSDGNVAFIATQSGSVFRLTGLNEVYNQQDANRVFKAQGVVPADRNVRQIFSGGSGGVTGIAIDPNDDNRLVITLGGYNSSDRVRLCENALANSPTFTNIHGNLPPMPIYDAEIDRTNGGTVLLGTEFGIWGTSDVNATTVEWTDENNALGYVPTYDIRQQSLAWEDAKNTGIYFVGTHGRGFWTSTTLVGMDEIDPVPTSKDAISGLKVFPNPMNAWGHLTFESSVNGNVSVTIYDVNGRRIKTTNERVMRGSNTIRMSVYDLRSGNYFAVVENGASRSVAKFIVMN